ncbi:MAG: polyhydroxyalkanoic acid system family protein [Pseudorhodoplanes sp.]|uniref:polyhydroxyalkanoic acid system family protein n=1 Tax=Pseudorhodoplanes sp. TaxID=1934341 RepID=UPI003D0EABDF
MSKPVTVSIPHSLGKEEALRRLKPGLTGAAKAIPVIKVDEEIWSGDRMTFRVRALAQTVAGSVDVADDSVRIEITLPWLLQKFADNVQGFLQKNGKLLLEKK